MALAAVAFVSVFATSCSEEDLNVNNGFDFELPAPTASVSVSVINIADFSAVGSVTTINATDKIGSTITVACPANDGYTTAKSVEVAIPAISKGQSVNVPVTFYVVKIESALAEILENLKVVEGSEKKADDQSVAVEASEEDLTNDSDHAVNRTIKVKVDSGLEYVGLAARATNDLYSIMKELKFNKVEKTFKLTIPAHTKATLKIVQSYITKNVTTKYNGVEDTFTVKEAKGVVASASFDWLPGHEGHGHDGHGHGNDANAGGGIVDAE